MALFFIQAHNTIVNDYRAKVVKRQIIALGGGGFAFDPENSLIEEYILRQTIKDNPSVCFIGTANGDQEELIGSFCETFSRLKASPCDLALSGQPPPTVDALAVGPDL